MHRISVDLQSGLCPNKGMTPRHRRGYHLPQSPFDSGGTCCIWMALVILGVVRNSDIRTFRLRPGGWLETTWDMALMADMQGSGDIETPLIVGTLPPQIRHKYKGGSSDDIVRFAKRRLQADELVMLELQPHRAPPNHWVLAVGLERPAKKSGRAFAILILDPAEPRSHISQWNTRLDLVAEPGELPCFYYSVSNRKGRGMSCQSAISLSRAGAVPDASQVRRQVTHARRPGA
jgi:hypothetical protein